MLIDVGGRSYTDAFYCSPGARAECLQTVFVAIGGRLRGTIQRSSSLTSSSSSRVVYESEADEEQCRLEAVKNFVF